MADNGPREGLDDWFDEPELPPDAWSTRVDRLVRERERPPEIDDWVEETAIRPAPRERPRRRPAPWLLVAAGLAVCLLLGILAAAGVFSSGGHPHALSTSTPTTAPSTPATTTTRSTVAAVPVPTAPLNPGASGAAVKTLQRALASAGYSTGTVDGSYGPATKSAVAAFQRAHGLTADGVAGPKTLAALAAALRQGTG